MKQLTVILCSILLSIALTNCGKYKYTRGVCQYMAMPPTLFLKLTKSGTVVQDDILFDTKLSYYEGGSKKYVSDFYLTTTDFQKNGLVTSRTIGRLSADNHIKIYYLEYPNGWASDTLFVDYLPHTPATNCVYVQQAIKFNGQSCSTDTSFPFNSPVYILAKQ